MDNKIVIALINSLIEKRIDAIDLTEFRGSRGPRGFKGRQGESGKDFVFSENKEEINKLVQAYIDELKEHLKLSFDDLTDEEKQSLKLSFDDLTDDEIQLLRGPRGQRGKAGQSVKWDDVKGEILDSLNKLYGETKDSFKLKFSDLTDEEKESLRLKFEHLTENQILDLKGDKGERGPRGQRGRTGIQGERGERGEAGKNGVGLIGPKGERGFAGRDGINGRDGKDGADAPKIIQIKVVKVNKRIKFIFVFNDGSEEETNLVDLPSINTFISQTVASSSGSGAGALEFFSEGVSLGTFEKVDFLNADVQVDPSDSTKLNVDVKTCIPIRDEGVEVSPCPKSIDFIGEAVQVLPEQVIANWPTLAAVDNMATFGGDPDNVKVVITGQAEKLTKTFEAGENIARLQPVRLTSANLIFQSDNDVDYETATVIGYALNAASAGNDVQVQFYGVLEDPSFSFVASEPIFLGDKTSQQNAPTNSGQFITEIAQGLGAGAIFVKPTSPVEIL